MNISRRSFLTGIAASAMMSVAINTKLAQTVLIEPAAPIVQAVGPLPEFDKVILPIVRRMIPSMIAHDIVGIQSMTAPSSQIYTLRYNYKKPTLIEKISNVFTNFWKKLKP